MPNSAKCNPEKVVATIRKRAREEVETVQEFLTVCPSHIHGCAIIMLTFWELTFWEVEILRLTHSATSSVNCDYIRCEIWLHLHCVAEVAH